MALGAIGSFLKSIRLKGSSGTVIGNISDSLNANDTLNGASVFGALTVGTSAVEFKIGGSALADRKYIMVQAKDSGVYLGFSNSVTTSNGIEIFKDQILMVPIGASRAAWLIATGAGKNVRIAEIA